MAERVFSATELRRFLEAVDAHLEEDVSIVLIGGSAAAIAYRVTLGTTDIDTYESDLRPLQRALALARHTTGLAIPVTNPSVSDVPYNYQDRLIQVMPTLERLTVLVPEKHDLALSKAVRAEENDLAALEELHALSPFDLEVLFARYLAEMGHAIGGPRKLDANFLLLVLRVFGELEYERTRRRLQAHRKARPS